MAVSLESATLMCLTEDPWACAKPTTLCKQRTLIGGSARQTRNASALRELLVIASDLTGACRSPPAFRRPKQRKRGYCADPHKKALG
jgi:hypothetical protein